MFKLRLIHIILITLLFSIIIYSCLSKEQVNISASENLHGSLMPEKTPAVLSNFSEEITPTFPEIPNKYNFPTWIADSKYAVFVMVTDLLKNNNEMTFVNANTHETFIINVPNNSISNYFWTPDGMSFGFVESNFLNILLVDLQTGKVEKYTIPETSSECLSDYEKSNQTVIKYIRVYSSLPSDNSFFCPESNIQILYDETQKKKTLIVENSELNRTIVISTANDNLINLNYEISPSHTLLAVLQGDEPDPDDRNPLGKRILVYSLISGEIISTFTGRFCLLKWSPNEEIILTTQSDSTICSRGESPLLLYPQSGKLKQIKAIKDAHHADYYISIFNWSLDSNFLYYVYMNPDRSDICRYDLRNDYVFCPTSGFAELDKYNVEYYVISPDERYLTFAYGYSCQGCDEWGESFSALIQVDGENIFLIGKEIYLFELSLQPYPFGTLVWRPMPN